MPHRTLAVLIALGFASSAPSQDFSGIFDCSYNDRQMTDFVTYACLLGFERADEPKWCAEFNPAYGAQAENAHRDWLARNADVLKEVRMACDARLLRAYGNDQRAIAIAKKEAEQRDAKQKLELRAKYWSGTQPVLNCSSYINGLRNDDVSGFSKFLQSVRDCTARPVRWPN